MTIVKVSRPPYSMTGVVNKDGKGPYLVHDQHRARECTFHAVPEHIRTLMDGSKGLPDFFDMFFDGATWNYSSHEWELEDTVVTHRRRW